MVIALVSLFIRSVALTTLKALVLYESISAVTKVRYVPLKPTLVIRRLLSKAVRGKLSRRYF